MTSFLCCDFSGAERMCEVIEDMTGSYPNIIFKLCWKYITPFIMLVSFYQAVI